MALKYLQTEEMLQITATWIDPQSAAHAAIAAIPEISAKLARAEDAHNALAAAAQPAKNPRIGEISAREGSIDLRHDAIIRGVFGFLTSLAEIVGGDDGARYIELRDILIPDGLTSIQKTYRAQAGQAKQLEDRLTTALKARADTIVVGPKSHPKTLTSYLKEWIALGKELGELEDEKGKLLAQEADASSGAAVVTARNRWIRVVNSILADVELVELAAEAQATVLGPLQDAERKAEVRARSGKPSKGTSETTPGAGEGSVGG
jgi:hypothetical protein